MCRKFPRVISARNLCRHRDALDIAPLVRERCSRCSGGTIYAKLFIQEKDSGGWGTTIANRAVVVGRGEHRWRFYFLFANLWKILIRHASAVNSRGQRAYVHRTYYNIYTYYIAVCVRGPYGVYRNMFLVVGVGNWFFFFFVLRVLSQTNSVTRCTVPATQT